MSFNKNKRKFAFIIHPRDFSDLQNKFYILKYVPIRILAFLVRFMPSIFVTSVKGLKDENGESVQGEIVSISLTATQMLHNRKLAKKHVIDAITQASKRGVTHVGLGAFTSVVTSGGEDIKKIVPGVHITNGNALTAYMTYISILELIEEHKEGEPSIAIIGATGSIGSAVTELLIQNNSFKNLYIVGRTHSNIVALLEKLSSYIHFKKVLHVPLDEALSLGDILISATSSDGVVIKPHLLKQNAIIYDITQPKNISKEILLQRPDVTVYDGGLIEVPKNVTINFNFGIPKTTTFSCLGETMLLSLSNYPDDFSLGKVTIDKVEYIKELAQKYNFLPAKKVIWRSN